MREEIERVIAELEKERDDLSASASNYDLGMWRAYQTTINKLKAVLSLGENDRSGIPGTDSE
jgi:exonuclease VII small subunit